MEQIEHSTPAQRREAKGLALGKLAGLADPVAFAAAATSTGEADSDRILQLFQRGLIADIAERTAELIRADIAAEEGPPLDASTDLRSHP